MAAPEFEHVHNELRKLKQFCVRVEKQPYVKDGNRKNAFSPKNWTNPNNWLTFAEAVDAVENGVKVYHGGKMEKVEGIGFQVARSDKQSERPLGGDLDCCRNPVTGFIGPWAVELLEKIQPFYTEISPSKCGLRFFVFGDLPVKGDSLTCNGPQGDMSESDREAILAAKPGARDKIVKGEAVFNGLEMYAAGRHLTITGDRLENYDYPVEDRSEAIKSYAVAKIIDDTAKNCRTPKMGLPRLDILDVINTREFAKSGAQLLGPHPTKGSTTGKNLVVDPGKNVYCWMHDGINAGGDAWTWLACECGAVKWEDAGSGVLKDAKVMRATLEYAVEKGYADTSVLNGDRKEPSELLALIKEDPASTLTDPAILEEMSKMDPIELDFLISEIKKICKWVSVNTIRQQVDNWKEKNKKKTEEVKIEASKDIKEKARTIAERGDSLKFLIWQAQRNHLGDIDYQKVLIASIASAASATSNGIQPGGNGDKGSGKSDACAATYHLVPMDRRLDGSLSPMSLFYLQEMGRLKPGMILFSDDVEYEPIIPIYKRATARFQHGITHFSVSGGKERRGIELNVPPRMVWWLTSVEGVANEQAFDRQYPISTDSSPGHKKRVTTEIAARRARKELRLAEDEGIEVAREIITDIFDNGPFKVLIPQAGKAEWLKISDFRGQEQFWDLVDALAILHWRQRQRDKDGWLIADDRDLIEAKAIFTGHKVAHYTDLTEAEAKLVGVMSSGRNMTQRELTEALGIAQSTLSARLASIMSKSAIITEDYDQGRKVYSINPKMQLDTDYWKNLKLVKLEIDESETYRSQTIALSYCYRYVIGLPIGIIINNSNRVSSSLSIDKPGSIEKGYLCDNCETCPLGVYLSIRFSAKPTDNAQKQQQETLSYTDKSDRYEPIRTDNDSSGLRYNTISVPEKHVIRRMRRMVANALSEKLSQMRSIVFRDAARTQADTARTQADTARTQADTARTQAEAARRQANTTLGDIDRHLGMAEERRKVTEAHTAEQAAKYGRRKVNLRIIKKDGYRTQVPLPDNSHKFVDHLYNLGDCLEVDAVRAKGLVERGVAEVICTTVPNRLIS